MKLSLTRFLDRVKVLKYFIDVFFLLKSKVLFKEEFQKVLEIFLDSQVIYRARKISSTFWNFSLKSNSDFKKCQWNILKLLSYPQVEYS